MDKNVQSVIKAYSTGRIHEKWLMEKGLRDYEFALIQTHCYNHDAAILNIGCGAGRETFALYQLGFRNVRGIDCTDALLQIAKKRSKEERCNIGFELATADKLPYPSETFDVVTMFENVYGHITPRSARLRSLAEINRVLKPCGLIIMAATSIYSRWYYFVFIKILEMLRMLYNPHEMEKGDKLWGKERRTNPERIAHARIHWFRRKEIPEDARTVGLSVLQATTIAGVRRNPGESSTKLYGQGWLIYVLQRPK